MATTLRRAASFCMPPPACVRLRRDTQSAATSISLSSCGGQLRPSMKISVGILAAATEPRGENWMTSLVTLTTSQPSWGGSAITRIEEGRLCFCGAQPAMPRSGGASTSCVGALQRNGRHRVYISCFCGSAASQICQPIFLFVVYAFVRHGYLARR